MALSNEEWVDDGPLADPALLNGVWGPWRDEYELNIIQDRDIAF